MELFTLCSGDQSSVLCEVRIGSFSRSPLQFDCWHDIVTLARRSLGANTHHQSSAQAGDSWRMVTQTRHLQLYAQKTQPSQSKFTILSSEAIYFSWVSNNYRPECSILKYINSRILCQKDLERTFHPTAFYFPSFWMLFAQEIC